MTLSCEFDGINIGLFAFLSFTELLRFQTLVYVLFYTQR